LAKAQADEFARKFERELLLVSHLSSYNILVGAWLLYSGATCHMIGVRELFESFTELDSDVHWYGYQACSMLMYLASDRYFHIGLVSSMWKSSLMPLKTLGNSLY
jgi:hypothetical protein